MNSNKTVSPVYYVWKVGGGGVPVSEHINDMTAYREAERLCKLHGGKFVVCQALAFCERNDVIWTKVQEPCPF